MKVLHINASYKPAFIYGGPTMSVSMLCEQLAKAGCHVQVFTTTANGSAELDVTVNKALVIDGVNLIYFKRITKDHSHFSPGLLKAVWKNARQYDVIHIHAWWNLVSVLSCVIALIRNVPVLVSPRGTLSPYSFQNKNSVIKSVIHNLLSKPALKRSHIHVTSKREDAAINSLITPKSITILSNFVKLANQQQAASQASSYTPFKLIFFSRIEEKKGLEILLDALALTSRSCHLTIAGNGNEDYVNTLKSLAAINGIAGKITWAGFINEDKFDVLRQHDLFVLPSYDENFGNAVIESLSTGTAVLVSEEVGLAGYVTENNLGWTCKTNKTAIAQTINMIAKEQQNRLWQIRQQAPGIIYHDFSAGQLIEKYIGLYNKIIRQN